MASLFKRKNHYWVSFYLEGKHIRKSMHTKIVRVATSKLRKLEHELAVGDLHHASKIPLETVLERFCRYLKASRTFKSYKNDYSRLRCFFGPVCESLEPGKSPGSKGPMPDKFAGKHVKAKVLEDITPQVINRFLAARIEQDGWSAKTANLLRQLLHRLFVYATKHHSFTGRDRHYPNPASGVDLRREAAPQIRFLSLEQIQEQLRVLSECPVVHAMVAIYIYSGLRREAATWLRCEDVDLDNRLIRVRAKTVEGQSWQPKTKRNRVVPISRALMTILTQYSQNHSGPWFFPSPMGKRWDPDNFSQNLRQINRKHGLQWSCLDFRHTFGSHLAIKGESLYKISTLMGNSPNICRKHYAALIPEQMQDTVEFEKEVISVESAGGDTRALLEDVLARVDKIEQTGRGRAKTKLRLVR